MKHIFAVLLLIIVGIAGQKVNAQALDPVIINEEAKVSFYDGPGIVATPSFIWSANVWQQAPPGKYAYMSNSAGQTIWSITVSDTSCYFQQKMANVTVGANLRLCPGDKATVSGYPSDTLTIATIEDYNRFASPPPVMFIGSEPYYWACQRGYWSYMAESALLPLKK